jgi:hypothetical protein
VELIMPHPDVKTMLGFFDAHRRFVHISSGSQKRHSAGIIVQKQSTLLFALIMRYFVLKIPMRR